ncbi:TraG [Loktanella sp. IMCC34160]|uniref:type IV secretion system DNA-binding domain-containing protein n=1 Tax=Loktanella sp. IMCC34160 TaxID=2510646 RepID=UPI00101C78A0|nr:type IV secretion system DNA-binding domain-containing protein [Loktanella sp. IMCC34160]RYG90082.1 TraG [Loktanella sp. IMCC34160]
MSRHSHSDHFIRGGQTMQHWLRMAAQVIKGGTAFAALVFFLTYVTLCASYYRVSLMHLTWAHWLATFAVENRGEPQKPIRFNDPDAGWIERSAEDIYLDEDIRAISRDYNEKAITFAWWSLPPALFAFLIVFGFFYFAGRRLDGDEHVRGTHLVSARDLKRWSDQKWKAYRKKFGKAFKTGPQYTVAGIKFPPNAVEAQTAICGTVGTGKSNAIKELLTTVRDHGGRAIIYDRMGAFVRDFYDPARDIIINPFDARSRIWTPFAEAEGPEFFTQMAEVLIPDRDGGGDQFWTQAARIVFDYAAQQIYKSGESSNARLRDAILSIPAEELADLIRATPGQHFFNEEIKKTSGSIRANLIAELRFLEFLRDDDGFVDQDGVVTRRAPFSIRKWIKEDGQGFVFLTGDAEHAAATRNIISTIFEVGANALMTCEEANDPRVWFIIDEVPTLNRMPFLPKSLAEIRQFGGAFVIGYQVYSQLEGIYGDKGAQTIAGNLNNRIIFNTPDADTAERFSKALGSEDVEERRESITVGAHETRDGVGFMSQRTERRIVTASQIQSLPQFEGYVRFAYDAPTAFVRFEPFATEARAPKFIPYHGSGMAEGGMEVRSTEQLLASGAAPNTLPFLHRPRDIQRQEFDRWRNRLSASGHAYLLDPERDATPDWIFFAHQRAKAIATVAVPPPPAFLGPMIDGSGYVIPEGFNPGEFPTSEPDRPPVHKGNRQPEEDQAAWETPRAEQPEFRATNVQDQTGIHSPANESPNSAAATALAQSSDDDMSKTERGAFTRRKSSKRRSAREQSLNSILQLGLED